MNCLPRTQSGSGVIPAKAGIQSFQLKTKFVDFEHIIFYFISINENNR